MGFNEALLAVVDESGAREPEPPVPLLLSVSDAARRLGVGLTLMRALVAAGEIESVKIGRLRRVPDDALATYVQQLRQQASQLRSRTG